MGHAGCLVRVGAKLLLTAGFMWLWWGHPFRCSPDRDDAEMRRLFSSVGVDPRPRSGFRQELWWRLAAALKQLLGGRTALGCNARMEKKLRSAAESACESESVAAGAEAPPGFLTPPASAPAGRPGLASRKGPGEPGPLRGSSALGFLGVGDAAAGIHRRQDGV